MNKYLITDAEFGGKSEEFSLLSAYFRVLDEDKNLIDELDLRLIPDNDIFTLSQEGMTINQIDIRNWDGITYKKAKPLVYEFLARNAGYVFNNGRWLKTIDSKRLRLVGQSVNGDVKSFTKYIISEESWDLFVAKTPLDTLYIATFLRDQGFLNLESISLRSLGEYFGLDTKDLHVARNDAISTWKVYEKLGDLIRIKKD